MGNTVCCEVVHEDQGPLDKFEDNLHSRVVINIDTQHDVTPHKNIVIEESIVESPKVQELDEIKEEEVVLEDPLNRLINQSDKKVIQQNGQIIQVPKLLPQVLQTLKKHSKCLNYEDFFEIELETIAAHRRRYHQDVYIGELDEETQKPNGFGKMHKADGNLYVGHFVKGKAHGEGVFIEKNGSYYKGNFVDNTAQTEEGEYSSQINYKGGFKDNTFHGKGKQIGEKYEFEGEYFEGAKVQGILKWQSITGAYEYKGTFNHEGKFQDQGGILKDPFGYYEGDFVNGQKHGKGTFHFTNGRKYIGDYSHNIRNGTGSLYEDKDTLVYEGQIKEGVPHGRGRGLKQNKMVQGTWIDGIQQSVI